MKMKTKAQHDKYQLQSFWAFIFVLTCLLTRGHKVGCTGFSNPVTTLLAGGDKDCFLDHRFHAPQPTLLNC